MSRTLQFLVFFSVIFVILGMMQWYLAASFRRWVASAWPDIAMRFVKPVRFVALGGTALLLLSFVVRGFGAQDSAVVRYSITFPAGIYFATIVLGFLVLAVKDIVALPIRWGVRVAAMLRRFGASRSTTIEPRQRETDEGRRRFLRAVGVGTAGTIVMTPPLASLATARDYQVRRIPLFFPNLPSELEGFTIAQVSDLHSGVFMSESDMKHIFEIVNGLHAQVTVVTGDQVDTNDSEIPPLHAALRSLRAERGVFAILGNHDHFATADKVAAATADAGLTVLRNEHVTLDVDGAAISLIGVDDCSPRNNHADLSAALRGLDEESFRVMLVHQPRFWPAAKRSGMDLTLVGHTHGGQVGGEVLGLKLYPVMLAYDYPMGHFIEEGKQLYVNVGVGMVGVPIRLVRPEIDVFVLHRGDPQLFIPRNT